MERARYRHHHHIMPPEGWLNDPNGCCFFGGEYHIFFQYAPESPLGGRKCWGHYASRDLLRWEFRGTALLPDTEFDRDGVYSGTAFTDDGALEVFYTGNVKHPGNFDYINEGRGHNVLHAQGTGGAFGKKDVLLVNADYPASLSCHVRDPKVWREGGTYYMLLGARTRESRAALLLLSSSDKKSWQVVRLYEPKDDMGYMLECPDYFELGALRVLGICPQGIPQGETAFQNVYQSGWCALPAGGIATADGAALDAAVNRAHFAEWDMGFDFYAPQTFPAPDGRRILVGWAGVPDAEYGNAPAVAEGWQHSMTLLRELSEGEGGRILQNPLREYASLRTEKREWNGGDLGTGSFCFDAEFSFEPGAHALLQVDGDLEISWADGIVALRFLNGTGCGRTVRRAPVRELRNVRLIMDESIVEIFLNGGETVFTTRYYPTGASGATLRVLGAQAGAVWNWRTDEQ